MGAFDHDRGTQGRTAGRLQGPGVGPVLQVDDLHDRSPGGREHVAVDGGVAFFVARERLERSGIGTDDHRSGLLAEVAGAGEVDARHRQVEVLLCRPVLHLSGADEHDVAAAELELLARRRAAQVVGADHVPVGHAVGAVERSDVEDDAARDQRRVVVCAAHRPGAAAEMLLGAEPVPVMVVVAEVDQRVYVRSEMRVHRDGVAAVRVLAVHVGAHPGGVVGDGAVRRVRHRDLIRRIAEGLERRHAHEVVDRQVEDVGTAGSREQGQRRLGRDPVQPADLVARAPRAPRHANAVALEQRLVRQLLSHEGRRIRRCRLTPRRDGL